MPEETDVYTQLLDAIAALVDVQEGSWRSKRDNLRRRATDEGHETDLEEFLGWW